MVNVAPGLEKVENPCPNPIFYHENYGNGSSGYNITQGSNCNTMEETTALLVTVNTLEGIQKIVYLKYGDL
jgi:hypothetical protein